MAQKLNRLEKVLRTLAEALARHNVRWALVGGLAVSVRTEPRFTRDVDVAVAVASDREAEQLVAALQRQGFNVFETSEHDVTGWRRVAARPDEEGLLRVYAYEPLETPRPYLRPDVLPYAPENRDPGEPAVAYSAKRARGLIHPGGTPVGRVPRDPRNRGRHERGQKA